MKLVTPRAVRAVVPRAGMRLRMHAGILASLFALHACSGDAPQVPTAATPTVSTTIAAVVAGAVSPVPSVHITDASGKSVKGVLVRWQVIAGGGNVANDSVRTNQSGDATSGGWTLGTIAGEQKLQASADGVATVVFTANAAPGPATKLVRLTAEPQQAVVGTTVPSRLAVRVEDEYGNPVAGVAVTFSVASGGGDVADAVATTNSAGVATAGDWRLGTKAGSQIARAAGPGGTVIAFSAVALPGPAADLIKVVGDNQQGLSSVAIALAPGVRVVDAYGNPVGGVPVIFTPGPGSGSVSSGIAVSDPSNGTAFVGAWTLGTTAEQTLLATSTLVPGKSVVFTATVAVSLFDIVVRYVGATPTDRQKAAIDRSVARWRAVILGNSGTSRVVAAAGSCGRDWLPAIDTVVTNLVVYARVGTIDGVNGVLGNANACAFHTSSGLTVMGTMLFDSEDLDRLETIGLTDAVVTHELGHALGVGTRWSFRGLLDATVLSDPIFTGPLTITQFLASGGGTYSGRPVPVENIGGSGTVNVHWRESVFRNELMTGFVNQGANPLSRITVASLADLGYIVSYTGAESFTIASSLLDALPSIRLNLGDDVVAVPSPATGRGVKVFAVPEATRR